MPGYNGLDLAANVSRFQFESPSLAPETFIVADFTGTEKISCLYHFEVDLLSRDPFIDFADVVNERAVFTLMKGLTPTPIHGLVVDFQQLGRTEDYVAYRAVLAPRLWRLALNYQSRIFQHLTVPEIIAQVLQEAGMAPADYRFDLQDPSVYQPREYCVQYQETDLDFICRLMEFEGIAFYFVHNDDAEMLVMTDTPVRFPQIDGVEVLESHAGEGMVQAHQETVHGFVCRERIVPGRVVLKDYNYETPERDLLVESHLNPAMPGVHYEYGEHYKDPVTGNRLARVRNEEIECRRRVYEGQSNAVALRGGHTFALTGHYRPDFNDTYLLVSVRHEGSQRGALGLEMMANGYNGQAAQSGDGVVDVVYHNTFSCRPARASYRPPRRTPVPQVPGVMIAKVERREGPYAGIDDQGCYRAKMNFDLAETDPADATLPIRMNQPYSGPNYGIHFPNHEDTEMIWACVNGDVDRPMALGTAPNPSQESPATSSNKWQSVIRSWGRNELTFDDKREQENIYMFATKDHTVEVTNDESISVGNDQTVVVKKNRTTIVEEEHDTLTVAEGTRTVTVKYDTSLAVEEGNRFVSVTGGDYVADVTEGNVIVTAAQNIQETAGDTVTIQAQTIQLITEGGTITLDSTGVTVSGPKIISSAEGDHELTGDPIKLN